MIPITTSQLCVLAPDARPLYRAAFLHADTVLAPYGINSTGLRLAHFMAQVLHESGNLTVITESMNYKADALISMFSRSRISEADARRYGRTDSHRADQMMVANVLYGGEFGRKNLGNTEPGDGWSFRGHYLLQHTGRDFFRRMAAKFRVSIEALLDVDQIPPDLVLQMACEEWTEKGCNAMADADDLRRVTKAINGGYIGLPEREVQLARTKSKWAPGG